LSESRFLAAAGLLTLAMLGAAFVVLGAQGPADGSSLSRGSGGWLGARRYLEETGTRVVLIDHDLEEPAGDGVLVLAFPWQRPTWSNAGAAVTRHLQRGGSVLIAYTNRSDPMEAGLMHTLGLAWDERRSRPPLRPRQWRAYAAEEWVLAAAAPETVGDVRVSAQRHVPRAPAQARILLRDDTGRAAAFVFRRHRGQVAVVPADVLSNGRIGRHGNAAFLELLRAELGGPWLFDEYHHGLQAAASPTQTGPQRALLLYVLQIAFVYALGALAVMRRFGPAWREEAVASGSAATFLLGLGALHDRLGHHGEAARLLVARAQELDPRLRLTAAEVHNGRELLALARSTGARQKGTGKIE
jgi:hypothetical protein